MIAERARAYLAQTFPLGAELPRLREWPARALLAAVLCPQGREHLAHRWRAWTALPGDRWRDPLRFLDGEVVGGRPGHATVRVRTHEAIYRGTGESRVEHDVDLRPWWPGT